MKKKIVIFGASGSGKTTLGKKLADALGYCHFDADKYTFDWTAEVPFTVVIPREERAKNLINDIEKSQGCVVSGNVCDWSESLFSIFDFGVFITAPTAIRLERITKREYEKFGDRIHEGGDMYGVHQEFVDWILSYDTKDISQGGLKTQMMWTQTLPFPVVQVDGTEGYKANIKKTMEKLQDNK